MIIITQQLRHDSPYSHLDVYLYPNFLNLLRRGPTSTVAMLRIAKPGITISKNIINMR